jgi:Zn-dependent protease with chaperone function
MTLDEPLKELNKGLQALQHQNYREAIRCLDEFCQHYPDQQSPFFIQAKMGLVRAYRSQGEPEKAIAICDLLVEHPNPEISTWARSILTLLRAPEPTTSSPNSTAYRPAGRAEKMRVKVLMPNVADSLIFSLLVALILPLLIIFGGGWLWGKLIGLDSLVGLVNLAILATLSLNFLAFCFSTWLLDIMQGFFYRVNWVNLGEIQKYSPETGDLLLKICRDRHITIPRLGVINDRRPISYSYGIRRNQARLIVSKGIFRYLKADEIATIYAHELGHILSRDCGVITFISTWGQGFYALYLLIRQGGNRIPSLAWITDILAWPFYVLFQIYQGLNLYVSRTREYYADHFAVEQTGNPNGLIRALVKVAKGIIKQDRQAPENPDSTDVVIPHFLEGMRMLAVYDFRTAQVSERSSQLKPQTLARLMLWEMVSPWSQLLEPLSSHPLPGRRIQILTYYAEQLDLDTEYGMGLIRQDLRQLNPRIIQLKFWLGLGLWTLPGLGLLLGLILTRFPTLNFPLVSALGFGFGTGLLLQTLIFMVRSRYSRPTDLLSLLYDPTLSPIGTQIIKCQGKLRPVSGAPRQKPKLYFSDNTAILMAAFPLWYQGWQKLKKIIPNSTGNSMPIFNTKGEITASFYRSLSPYLIIHSFTYGNQTIRLYPYLSQGLAAIALLMLSVTVFKNF